MHKKILLTGSHSTGKSTLLRNLQNLKQFQDFKFIGGVTREAHSYGLDINEKGDSLTQLYCMCKDFLNIVQNQNSSVVFDRSILDTYIYSQYLNKNLEPWVLTTMTEVCSMLIGEFDLILWLRPELPITDDRVRSLNVEFQLGVDQMFETYFKYHSTLPVYHLKGNIRQRILQVKELLK